MREAASIAEAVVRSYDMLNPHHSDSVDKSKGYHDLIEMAPLDSLQIGIITAGIEYTRAEADKRNGAFSSRLIIQLEMSLKMLAAKKPVRI